MMQLQLNMKEVSADVQEILNTHGKVSIKISEEDFKKIADVLPKLLLKAYAKGLEKGLHIGNPSGSYKVFIEGYDE